MNKKIFWTIFLSLTLAGCASIRQIIPGNSAAGGASSDTELPMQTKLILGVMNLEETDNAITTEQAIELLPMFHVLKDLNESDTAAQEEIDGLTNQIQETLTTEQVNAIDAMNLTRRDMFSFMRGGNDGGTNSTQGGSNFGGGNSGRDGPPPDMGGGFPGGGFPGGGGPSNSTRTSDGNATTTGSQITQTPSALFDAAIGLLEKKVQ